MTDKEKIREEVERLYGTFAGKVGMHGECDICCKLLSFIDSLQEEPESDDLNIEAIKEELDKAVRIYTTGGDFGWGTLYNIACHFSEWQKQQMMKDAVEGWIEADDNRDMNVWARSENFRFLKEHITTPLNVGDKVKLIIIKEE